MYELKNEWDVEKIQKLPEEVTFEIEEILSSFDNEYGEERLLIEGGVVLVIERRKDYKRLKENYDINIESEPDDLDIIETSKGLYFHLKFISLDDLDVRVFVRHSIAPDLLKEKYSIKKEKK